MFGFSCKLNYGFYCRTQLLLGFGSLMATTNRSGDTTGQHSEEHSTGVDSKPKVLILNYLLIYILICDFVNKEFLCFCLIEISFKTIDFID